MPSTYSFIQTVWLTGLNTRDWFHWETVYTTSSRELKVNLTTEFLVNLDGKHNICVFIAESGIVAPQQDEITVIEDYVHNHVLRTSMNGTWGDAVGIDGTAVAGEENENSYSMTLDGEWVAENCSVIAFVYHEDSRQIIQAEEAHVIE